jgi:hypothetical protein
VDVDMDMVVDANVDSVYVRDHGHVHTSLP